MNDHEKVLRELRAGFVAAYGTGDASPSPTKARIAALDYALAAIGERGEPVATVDSWANGSYHRKYSLTWHRDVPAGTKLYATTPPTQGAQPNEEKGNG